MQGNWHHDYLWPICWAILLHLLLFLLLLIPKSTPVSSSSPVIRSYLYTPPVTQSLPEIANELRPSEPLPVVVETTMSTQAASQAANAAAASAFSMPQLLSSQQESETLNTQLANQNETPSLSVASVHSEGSLLERSLTRIANQYQQPESDYQSWRQQQLQLPASRSEPWQRPGATPEQRLLYTYHDGKQLVRLDGRCVIADPQLSGWEQLKQLRGVACKEGDDAILFRETMSKWQSR